MHHDLRSEGERQPFGALLRRYRLDAALTQEALAERAQLSARGIADLERGARRSPYPRTVERLVQALGLNAVESTALMASTRHRRPRMNRHGRPLALSRNPTTELAPSTGRLIDEPALGRARHNLPAHLPSLIGREEALTIVQQRLLGADAGLLTLTGAGGSGKTRLALAVAESMIGSFSEGIWFVELASLSDPALIAATVLRSIGRGVQPGRPASETLRDAIGGRGQLVVLDNCEHLVEGCAVFVNALLKSCPRVRVLATSREPLRAAGEQTWRVPTLACPTAADQTDPARMLDYPAVRLFVARAQARAPSFTLTAANCEAVGSICVRLDGLPLALELAAAWAQVLSPAEILQRLADTFRLLVGGNRTDPTRHQTLRASLNWSFQLLSPPEQETFRMLSVFNNGWTLDAALRVVGQDALEHVASLLDKSLIRNHEDPDGTRFSYVDSVRSYALERLAQGQAARIARQRHATYMLEWVQATGRLIRGPEQGRCIRLLQVEHDNIRGAIEWFNTTGRARQTMQLVASLPVDYWLLPGYFEEAPAWMRTALLRDPTPSLERGVTLDTLACLISLASDHSAALAALRESVAILRSLDANKELAVALTHLATQLALMGDCLEAQSLSEESMCLACAGGDPRVLAHVLSGAAFTSRATGTLDRALHLLEESMDYYAAVGDRRGWAFVVHVLAGVMTRMGRTTDAEPLIREACILLAEFQDLYTLVSALFTLMCAKAELGQSELAAKLSGAAEALAARIGANSTNWLCQEFAQRGNLLARTDLGEAEFKRAVAIGRSLPLERVLCELVSSTRLPDLVVSQPA